jgi:hypothetical protein
MAPAYGGLAKLGLTGTLKPPRQRPHTLHSSLKQALKPYLIYALTLIHHLYCHCYSKIRSQLMSI